MSTIALIVGLGNPGPGYDQTRHNAGFWFVEELARRYGGHFKAEPKFFGESCRIDLHGHDCRLLKPTTFMNRSGQAVAAIAGFYKIPVEAILVAHDELDIPAGTARLKQGGGHGGHNGLRDLMNRLGGNGFWRLRLGIDHPGHKDQVVDYVLTKPSAADRTAISDAIDAAADLIPAILGGDTARAMNQLHSRR